MYIIITVNTHKHACINTYTFLKPTAHPHMHTRMHAHTLCHTHTLTCVKNLALPSSRNSTPNTQHQDKGEIAQQIKWLEPEGWRKEKKAAKTTAKPKQSEQERNKKYTKNKYKKTGGNFNLTDWLVDLYELIQLWIGLQCLCNSVYGASNCSCWALQGPGVKIPACALKQKHPKHQCQWHEWVQFYTQQHDWIN